MRRHPTKGCANSVRLDNLPGKDAEVVSAEQASSSILKAEDSSSGLSVDPKDPLGLAEGSLVSIETVECVAF
jgi:hypothetical protein